LLRFYPPAQAGGKEDCAYVTVDVVQLTEEQVEIAVAQGCRFIEASEAQVRQFSMQRRVFQIAGKACLAARADGFYETAGTMSALIAQATEQPRASTPEPEPYEAVVQKEPAEAETHQEVLSAKTTPDTPEVHDEPVTAAPLEGIVAVPAQETASPPRTTSSVVARTPQSVLSAMTTIAEGYMRGHRLNTAQLSALLVTVHRTLAGLAGSRGLHLRQTRAEPGDMAVPD
jgi:hypothetical protein